jgi:hypothetical protein
VWVIKWAIEKHRRYFYYNPLYSFDDLFSEGMVIFGEVKSSWKPNGKASFKTYFATALINRFRDLMWSSQFKIPVEDYMLVYSRRYMFTDDFKKELNKALNYHPQRDWRKLQDIKNQAEEYTI